MSITRRTMVSAGGVALASTGAFAQAPAAPVPSPVAPGTPASPGAPVVAVPPAAVPAPAASAAQPSFYRRKVGDFEVIAMHEGTVARPLDASFVRNAPFEEVQAALARAYMSTTTLPNTFTTLLVDTGRQRVLLDSGFGDSGPAGTGGTLRALAAAGIDRSSIDVVAISHFHGDHIGGLRLKDGSLTFPKAQIMVPEAEWAFWMDDSRMASAPDAMKVAFQNSRRVFGPDAAKIEQYGWGKEILPGVTALEAAGHTAGHTAFMLSSGNGRLLVASDTSNHPALFVRNPDWSAVFDMDADKARSVRRRFLDMAATERLPIAFYHAPFPAGGYIAKAGTGFEFVPLQWGAPS